MEPDPLIKLALHLYAVVPNSASCERLFSSFGVILTKLRSRLSASRMLGLAELKMHLRDEQTRLQTKKKVRKRIFGARKELPATQASMTVRGELEVDTIQEQGPEVAEEYSSEASSLRELFAHFIDLANAEAELEDPSGSGDIQIDNEPEPEYGDPIKIDLANLFDLRERHWIKQLERSAHASFDEELRLRDLLDFDAEGEDDLGLHIEEDQDMLFDE